MSREPQGFEAGRSSPEPWRETMTTGRNLAAKPRSAIQTSPGSGFIELIQNFRFHLARPCDIEKTQVRQFDDLGHLAPNPLGGFRAPFPEHLITSLD